MKRAVFLDRDGVINKAVIRDGKPYPPATLEDFILLPNVISTSLKLRKAGFLLVVVTNQPDVGTGVQSLEVVEAMHRQLLGEGICDDIRACYHIDVDNCDCRKPKPGMLLAAAQKWQIDLSKSFIIGDRWRDIAAGKAAGCYTFFIDYQYREQCIAKPDLTVASMQEAGNFILQNLDRSIT